MFTHLRAICVRTVWLLLLSVYYVSTPFVCKHQLKVITIDMMLYYGYDLPLSLILKSPSMRVVKAFWKLIINTDTVNTPQIVMQNTFLSVYKIHICHHIWGATMVIFRDAYNIFIRSFKQEVFNFNISFIICTLMSNLQLSCMFVNCIRNCKCKKTWIS